MLRRASVFPQLLLARTPDFLNAASLRDRYVVAVFRPQRPNSPTYYLRSDEADVRDRRHSIQVAIVGLSCEELERCVHLSLLLMSTRMSPLKLILRIEGLAHVATQQRSQ